MPCRICGPRPLLVDRTAHTEGSLDAAIKGAPHVTSRESGSLVDGEDVILTIKVTSCKVSAALLHIAAEAARRGF